MDVASMLRPLLSLRTAWGFRACARGRQCWAEPSVLPPGAREPGLWCRFHFLVRNPNAQGSEGAFEMPARSSKIRVMIADDHAILRAGLRMLVDAQSDMEVVSEAPDGEKAVQTARETKPTVALLDLTMPRVGG